MITNKLFNIAVTGLVMLSSAFTFAQNEPCYGSEVLDYVKGHKKNSANLIDADRAHSDRALGIPEDDNTENFVTLGYGGSITIRFSGAVYNLTGNDVQIVETSYASNNCLSDGIEKANVEVSQDGVTFFPVGSVCRNGAIDIEESGLSYIIAVKIINDDAACTTTDGYDVDGIIAIHGCQNVDRPGCFAVEVVAEHQGTRSNGQPITDPIRIHSYKALGVPENNRTSGADNFYTLGKEGWIVLRMGAAIKTDATSAPDLRVFETTWGNLSCANYPEYAEVSVSADSFTWYSLGTVCQSSNISLDVDAAVGAPVGLLFSYVKIANSGGNTDDYFDVDGVEALWGCQDVPVIDRGGCYAECEQGVQYVQGTKKNGQPIAVNRRNKDNALGAPQQNDTINFVTLGYGGSIVLCFNGAVFNEDGDDIQIIETSFGSPACEDYKEYADVQGSIDGIKWYNLTTGCMDFTVDIATAIDPDTNAPVNMPYINYLRIANNDLLSQTEDGYDVDGVIVLSSECAIENEARAAVNAPLPSNEMVAWPNPSKGDLNFDFTSYVTGKTSIELYNTKGQLVAKVFNGQTFAGEETKVNFDGTTIPNGIYISRLTTESGVISGKVVLNH